MGVSIFQICLKFKKSLKYPILSQIFPFLNYDASSKGQDLDKFKPHFKTFKSAENTLNKSYFSSFIVVLDIRGLNKIVKIVKKFLFLVLFYMPFSGNWEN